MTSQNHALPEPGDLIAGRFRILQVIGTGGFGTVFRAVQENIGREVALKFLTPGVAKDPINVERFRREAFHISQLRHPNTITLYDYGQTEDELAYMVMELLDGDALGDLIQTHGAISLERTAHIFIQVLKSLSEAHRHGLVHRDLKPENIFLCEMFGETDYVKVLDFGVAKMTLADDDEDGDALTRAGRIFGTPLYMAPEQACAEPITPATDVYALGLLLFEILTGQPPVTGRNRMDVIHKQIRDPVPVLTDELKGTVLGEIIQKACEKDPEHRFQDASQFLQAFHHALAQMQVVPSPRGGDPSAASATQVAPPEAREAQTLHPPIGSDADTDADADADEATIVMDNPEPPAGSPKPPPVQIQRSSPSPSTSDQPFGRQPHSRPHFDLPLIGRDGEFDKLRGLLRSSIQMGTGQMILVEGEGGIGKTHLVRAVIHAMADEKVTLSTAEFRRRSSSMEALRDAIANLWDLTHFDRQQVQAAIEEELRSLGGFSDADIRGLTDFLRPPQEGQSTIDSASAGVLYARLERLLIRLASSRALILVFEDLQYADSATLAFLEYLAVTVRTHKSPLTVLFTMRPEERGLNPDLDQHLRTISANVGAGFERLRLRRLGGISLSQFLDAILPLESRLKERVGWLSHGVPLHAIQIIRYLQNEDELQRRGDRWHLKSGNPRNIDLPPDLMDLMSLRIQQAIDKHSHRPYLRRVLRWLAVLGMKVPVDLLRLVLQEAEDLAEDHDLDRDLQALSQEGLCKQTNHQNLLCVEFENSLLRETLLDQIREQWSTRRLHAVAANKKIQFYHRQDIEIPVVEIADHWRQSGDTQRYRDALAEACRRSMARFDLRGARGRYRELLNLLDDLDQRGDLWTEAHLELADLARRFGEFGLAEDHYRRAVDSGEAQGTEKSRALRGFGHLLRIQSRPDEASDMYRRALKWSQDLDDLPGIAKALVGLSQVHLTRSDPRKGRRVRQRLESMLDELKSPAVHGTVLLHLAEAARRQGKLNERYDYLVRAREALENSSDQHSLSDALIALGSALMQPSLDAPNRFDHAQTTLEQALELKRSLGERQGVAEALRYLGQLAMERENFDEAQAKLQRSLDIHKALGTPFNIAAAHNAMGILHLLTGDYADAETHFDTSAELFDRVGDRIAKSHALLNTGIASINQQEFHRAQSKLREARRLKESLGTSWALFDLRNNLAIVNMWFGEFDTAEHLLKETLEHVDEHGTAEDRATAHSLMGLLQAFLSRLQMAALELGRARADAEELDIERVRVFCQANAAFYALLTESHSDYEPLIESVDDNNMLAELDRGVWLALLARMAHHISGGDRSRQSVRLLVAAAILNERYQRTETAQGLRDAADSLEKDLSAFTD